MYCGCRWVTAGRGANCLVMWCSQTLGPLLAQAWHRRAAAGLPLGACMHACCATAPCEGALRDASLVHSGWAARFFSLASVFYRALARIPIISLCFTAYTHRTHCSKPSTHNLSAFHAVGVVLKVLGRPKQRKFCCSSRTAAADAVSSIRCATRCRRARISVLDAGLLHDSLLRRTNDHVLRLRRR